MTRRERQSKGLARFTCTSLFCALIAAGCDKHSQPDKIESFTTTPPPLAKSEWGEARFNVCALLTKEEVAEIEGSPVKETRAAGGAGNSLFISQCFYMSTPAQPVVELSVIEKDPSSSSNRRPNDLWTEMFERGDNKESDEENEERAEGKQRVPPQKVEGVGDAAYWTNGALYVRSRDKVLRIAITRSDTLANKLSKTSAIGRKVVPRL